MDDLVVKRNDLIQASYRLTNNEQSIILYAITHLNPKGEVTDDVLYRLNVLDLATLTDTCTNLAYRDFKQAALRLFDRKIVINEDVKTLTRFVQTVKYKDSEGIIEIRFSKEILPYLTQIKDNFTKYRFKHVAKFKSSYGVRLYELLIQRMSISDTREINIEWLKDTFQLGQSYEKISNLKNKVIEPALRDINNYSDISVTYEQIKQSRKVIAFKFKVILNNTTPVLTHEYIQEHARAGESWDDAKKRLLDNKINPMH